MSYSQKIPSEQVLAQLVEADVEMGFALVDDTLSHQLRGDSDFSTRALAAADEVVRDIEQRLQQLGAGRSEPFQPLLAELRRQIEAARQRA